MVGTHTHVQTADEQILPKGTAYLTDIGMTGPLHSVIGIKKGIGDRKISDRDAATVRSGFGPSVSARCCSNSMRVLGKPCPSNEFASSIKGVPPRVLSVPLLPSFRLDLRIGF